MSIDPSTLDPETVIEWCRANSDVAYLGTAGRVRGMGVITRVFEPVPNPDEALPHGQWASIKKGTRVRIERWDGCVLVGNLSHIDCGFVGIGSLNMSMANLARVWVLSEPVDPDADLIKKIKTAILTCGIPTRPHETVDTIARAALAVVRAEGGAK